MYRSIKEESSAKAVFEEYVARLQEKAKDKERKREEEKVSELADRICLVSFFVLLFALLL